MDVCEVCGNSENSLFDVVVKGQRHRFDCFECAIHAMAPICGHCGNHIIGHAIERDGLSFCCSHCSKARSERVAHDLI